MPYMNCPTCAVSAYSAAAYSTTHVCPVCGTPIPNGNGVAEVPGCRTLTREFVAEPDSIPEARRALESLEEELGEALHERGEPSPRRQQAVEHRQRHPGPLVGEPLEVGVHLLDAPGDRVGAGVAHRGLEAAGEVPRPVLEPLARARVRDGDATVLEADPLLVDPEDEEPQPTGHELPGPRETTPPPVQRHGAGR